ncbi:hypothetical protein D3C76_615760 [compost metagenome]
MKIIQIKINQDFKDVLFYLDDDNVLTIRTLNDIFGRLQVMFCRIDQIDEKVRDLHLRIALE